MRVVGGKFGGTPLAVPKGRGTRPTSDRTREAMFSILMARPSLDLDGARIVDLFAGTGALGLEALSAAIARPVGSLVYQKYIAATPPA